MVVDPAQAACAVVIKQRRYKWIKSFRFEGEHTQKEWMRLTLEGKIVGISS
ncbi:hypothetical protein A2U01_0051970, partial [Trifolium medium]|nr:hypothetical protein [Trifolium medium]